MPTRASAAVQGDRPTASCDTSGADGPAFTNNADEGVGSGPGGPPYIKLRNQRGGRSGLYKQCRRGRRQRSRGTALQQAATPAGRTVRPLQTMPTRASAAVQGDRPTASCETSGADGPAFTNNADEGVGSGPGGPPYIK